jgi:O-acetyl-ADP-ribose deacetylase (regulator of RNase III)
MLETVNRSILDADEQYIVHQLNCVTNHAAGLALAIFQRFPYADVYSQREYPHTPTSDEQPGNIIVCGNGEDQRFVVGIYGQYYPGKSKYPDGKRDGILVREIAFNSGLQKIAYIPGIQSVAFPIGIGCRLAGGDWSTYERMISDWAAAQPIKTTMYKYEG